MSGYQSRSHVTRPGSATKVVLFSQRGLDGNRRARAGRRADLEALADGPFEPVVPAVGEVFLGSRIFLVPTLGNLEVIRQKLRQVDELADEGAVLVEDDNGVEERLPAGAAALARLVAVDDDVGVLERRRAADLREGRPDEGEALDRAGIVADNVDVSYIG